MTAKDSFESCIDTTYSYQFAKKMESFRSNPNLGYRTAGSMAEFQTGEMIAEEMKAIGLKEVIKDEITLDSWEFERAQMKMTSKGGIHYLFELGSYQTQFVTNGFHRYDLVYVKKGTAQDYKNLDVKNKLVLVDINQRDEWWINYPVYQAYLKGAAALIAVQENGYGEINDKALNAQDIAGPSYAPAFSMSKADADIIKQELRKQKSISVQFDASSIIKKNQPSYNILGKMLGRSAESMLLVTAHYDSYFNGFQDDNCAVAMMLGIARALIKSGYRPQKTILFCAMAAEEWGIENTKYDWSTGAFQEVFYVHPKWQGKVCANINFELPALAHGEVDKICCVYEYRDYLKTHSKEIKIPKEIYPEGLEVVAPVKTWSDDFSIAIAGIPSMVNDFSDSKYMETHYHSQFDNEKYYEEQAYYFHHNLYGRLLMDFDQATLPPLNFTTVFTNLVITTKKVNHLGVLKEARKLNRTLFSAKDASQKLYREITKINQREKLSGAEEEMCLLAQKRLLTVYKKEQDAFVRLNWHDDVRLPHEIVIQNLKYVISAIDKLKQKDAKGAMNAIYHIDNNRYAFLFEREVFEYFTSYVLEQPRERLQWGEGRIIGHENLFDLVASLKKKETKHLVSYRKEIEELTKVKQRQVQLLRTVLIQEEEQVHALATEIKKIYLQLLSV